jgi:prolyl-tRNA editing enzyme YbaK/EbsC (Cys-tRNA(Pro) deacylase)
VVDADLDGYPELWAAAGTPHSVFRTSFAELVALTGGTALSVA